MEGSKGNPGKEHHMKEMKETVTKGGVNLVPKVHKPSIMIYLLFHVRSKKEMMFSYIKTFRCYFRNSLVCLDPMPKWSSLPLRPKWLIPFLPEAGHKSPRKIVHGW